MEETLNPYEENTPQQKFIRRGGLIFTILWTITFVAVAVASGFGESLIFPYALIAIGLFLSAATTFALWWRIQRGDIDDEASIPVYTQMVILIYLGCIIIYGTETTECNCKKAYIEKYSCWEDDTYCLVFNEWAGTEGENEYGCIRQSVVNATTNDYACRFKPGMSSLVTMTEDENESELDDDEIEFEEIIENEDLYVYSDDLIEPFVKEHDFKTIPGISDEPIEYSSDFSKNQVILKMSPEHFAKILERINQNPPESLVEER